MSIHFQIRSQLQVIAMPIMYCTDVLTKISSVLIKEGLLPTKSLTKLLIIKRALHVVYYSSIVALLCGALVKEMKLKNFEALNRIVMVFIPVVNIAAKPLAAIWKKDYYFAILLDLSSDVFNIQNEKLNEHIKLVNKISSIVLRSLILLTCVFLSVVSCLPFIVKLETLIPSPFHKERYDTLYKIFHLSVTIYLGIISISFDILYMTLMGLCVGQLNILEERLINVLEEATDIQQNNKLKGIFIELDFIISRILKECVILHEMVNEFIKKLSMVLSPPLFIQYSCGCLLICNAILQLTILGQTGISNVIFITTYSSMMCFQILAYHWLGNEIIIKSSNIMDSCYLSNWYNLPLQFQKVLISLMERSKRPSVIKLYGLIYITLDSMVMIFRWSYSLFALIKARYS